MDSPPFANRTFANYYLGLGISIPGEDQVSSDDIRPTKKDNEGALLTRIVTRGPDGSTIEISPTITRQSRGNSISKAIKKAWEGLANVFRHRRRSSATSTQPAICTPPTHLPCQTGDVPAVDYILSEQLQRWMWPLEDQPPNCRRAVEVDPRDAMCRSNVRCEERFFDVGLDYAFLERPQRMVPF